MELFTVDTAGDQDLLNANHVSTTDTEYFAKDSIVENVGDVNRPDDEQDDEENDEDEFDYGGEAIEIGFSHSHNKIS